MGGAQLWSEAGHHYVGSGTSWEGVQYCQGQPFPVSSQGHLLGAAKCSAVGSCLCWALRLLEVVML